VFSEESYGPTGLLLPAKRSLEEHEEGIQEGYNVLAKKKVPQWLL
jgi:hypothetical protein